MGLCLAPNCQDGTVKIGGVVGSACVADCGARYSSAWRQDSTGWSRTSHYVDGLKLYVSGTGPAVDGQETAVSFAIYRVAGESELAGHWICATGGTIVPYQYSSDSPMDQPFTLTGLSDLGPCTGDAANTDVLTLNLNGASSTVSGSALGQSVGFVGSSPFCTPYDCDLNVDRLSQFAGSLFTILTENPNNTGSPVPLDDAIWLGPRSLDVDAICGGPASTVTRAADASFTTALIEFRELQGMRCPGTPIEGTLTGSF
jgi:hypothetical protein